MRAPLLQHATTHGDAPIAIPVERRLAQRSSTFPAPGSVAAPAIRDAGQPLETSTRHAMEASFGQDLSGVRVHDDGRAHDDARALGARAYAAGEHIVFAQGAYRPESASGRALLAHELAHSIQQGGVQLKADGPLPAAADAELEAQADRAALEVTAGRSAPALSKVNAQAVFRAVGDPAAAPEATSAEAARTATGLPSDVELIDEAPRGDAATRLAVALPVLVLPLVKGMGSWVLEAYKAKASGGGLVFAPLFSGATYESSPSIAAFKESAGDKYKNYWLGRYGFATLRAMASAINAVKADPDVDAILKKPGVQKIVDGFAAESLLSAGCDIDHIVEKQVGGTSVPANMQLLVADKNRAAGVALYDSMLAQIRRILLPNRRRVEQLSIQFRDASVPVDSEDPSYWLETLLRKVPPKLVGSVAIAARSEGSPLDLVAGGAPETVRVGAGVTPIDMSVRRLIPGMKLVAYTRRPGSTARGGVDEVEAELVSKPINKGTTNVKLNAEVAPASAGPGAAGGPAQVGERRKLRLDPAKNQNITFYYPYLSPGRLTRLALDDQNNLTGEGVITPSVRFLGELRVAFGPDRLDLIQNIDTAAINRSAFMRPLAPMFRFTSGDVRFDLVQFKPQGNLEFTLGPASKPVILGRVQATEEGGAFVVIGTLTPARAIPGISAAQGQVSYRSDRGWSGQLTASSSSIPNSTVDVLLGFDSDGERFRAFGRGGIITKIRDNDLSLRANWSGTALSYAGAVTLLRPLPLVQSVRLQGTYADELLSLTGSAAITWRAINANMTVNYRRRDGEAGKLSGRAEVPIRTEKASGSVMLNYDEAGVLTGRGEIGYQVTPRLRPRLGVELTQDQRVKMLGDVAVDDVPLSRMWPGPNGGRLTLIRGAGAKFNVPTPVPGVSAFGELRVSAGLAYGVGPVMLRNLVFHGELYPLEDDPQVRASLRGKLAVPAYGEIFGTFGAYIGAEVLLGAGGARGGIEVTPALRITGEGGVDIDAAYEAGGFSFAAEAYARGSLDARLNVDLTAEIYAAWGTFSKSWTYKAAQVQKRIGPELRLTLGRIAYSRDGEVTWPNVSQIKLEPESIDPLEVVRDLLGRGRATESADVSRQTR